MSKIDVWIRNQLSKGYSFSQIEQYLLNQGYNKQEIDALILKASSENVLVQPKKSHTWTWIIVILLVLIVSGGAYHYFVIIPSLQNVDLELTSNKSGILAPPNDYNSAKSNNSILNNTPSIPVASTDTIVNTTFNVSSNISINTSMESSVNVSTNSSQPRCGDSKIDPGEECDTYNFGGLYCTNFTAPNDRKYNGGILRCNNCTISTNACDYCGDGVVNTNAGEWCERDVGFAIFKKDGKTHSWLVSNSNPCVNFGYESGTIYCNTNTCKWNITGCHDKINYVCGNGILENGEECDYNVLGRVNESRCQDFNETDHSMYTSGELMCTQDCMHDFSDCD